MQLFALLALVAQTAAASTPRPSELRGEVLMDSLRAGGYTILLRHARTDRSFREAMGAVPVERSAQRNLTEDGVRDAKLMGVVLRKYGIPIGEIIASPMYRTRETAELAAGTPTITMTLRSWPSTAEQAALVAAAPPTGTNRLLVTHHFVLETHVPGIRPGDIAESEAAVIAPMGDGKVRLVGRITLPDWERLAGVRQAQAHAPVAGHGGHSATAHERGAAYGTSGPTGTPASPGASGSRGTSGSPVASDSPGTPGVLRTIPHTPLGNLALRYLDAFNSGDPRRMRAFIDSALVADPQRPTDLRVRTFEETRERLGPLTPMRTYRTSAEELSIVAHGKGGEYLITVRASPDHPGRAASILIALGTSGGGHP